MAYCANTWLSEPQWTSILRYRHWNADNIFTLRVMMPPYIGFYNSISGFQRECAGSFNHFYFVIDEEEYNAGSIVSAQCAVSTANRIQFIIN
jgi:hypothetical protein